MEAADTRSCVRNQFGDHKTVQAMLRLSDIRTSMKLFEGCWRARLGCRHDIVNWCNHYRVIFDHHRAIRHLLFH